MTKTIFKLWKWSVIGLAGALLGTLLVWPHRDRLVGAWARAQSVAEQVQVPAAWDSSLSHQAKTILLDIMREPRSAEFGPISVFTSHKAEERHACGTLNGRNGYGGYTGRVRFVVTFRRARDGTVTHSAPMLETTYPENAILIDVMCVNRVPR